MLLEQSPDVEWLFFRTDNGTEFLVDYAASQYGLFDFLQALPRPRGLRPYEQWGARELVEQVHARAHTHTHTHTHEQWGARELVEQV